MTTDVLKDDVKRIADAISDKVTIEAGRFSIDNDDVKALLEGEGVKVKDLRAQQAKLTDVFDGITLAVGNKSVEHMAKNKDIDEVTGSLKLGRETMKVTTSREGEKFTGAITDPNRKKVKYLGAVRSSRKHGGSSQQRLVRNNISEMATKLLK